ncbi:hypothetical protein GCM10010466_29400 [Planomonospora alba]|uniref:Uncharacterized protein n=1 Tax=Planomonospora alba TaxID=161354 RepID=A0ABP6N514_9ACTN
MAEYSFPFDGGTGAAITEDQWSYMAGSWQDDGVEAEGPASQALKVSSQVVPLTLSIQPGHAFLKGFHYYLDTSRTLAFTENLSEYDRVDRVVLRLDRTSNTVSIAVKTGTPAPETPVPPAVSTDYNTPEVSLATFTVRAGANTVLSGDVVDARPFCGKRVRVAENLSGLPVGSVAYRPESDRFGLVRSGGVFDGVAMSSEIAPLQEAAAGFNLHKVDPDPHMTYMNQTRGDARYSQRSHTHVLASSSNTGWLPATNYQTLGFTNRLVLRGGVVSVSFYYSRRSTSGAADGELVTTLPVGYRPMAAVLLPAYVSTNDRSTVTKAGAVHVATDGQVTLYQTFVGYSERIIVTGMFFAAPNDYSIPTEG